MPPRASQEPWGASGRYALWTMYVVGGYFGVVAVFNHLSAWAKHNRCVRPNSRLVRRVRRP